MYSLLPSIEARDLSVPRMRTTTFRCWWPGDVLSSSAPPHSASLPLQPICFCSNVALRLSSPWCLWSPHGLMCLWYTATVASLQVPPLISSFTCAVDPVCLPIPAPGSDASVGVQSIWISGTAVPLRFAHRTRKELRTLNEVELWALLDSKIRSPDVRAYLG